MYVSFHWAKPPFFTLTLWTTGKKYNLLFASDIVHMVQCAWVHTTPSQAKNRRPSICPHLFKPVYRDATSENCPPPPLSWNGAVSPLWLHTYPCDTLNVIEQHKYVMTYSIFFSRLGMWNSFPSNWNENIQKKAGVLTASITFLYWSDIILQTLVIERNLEGQTIYRRTPLEFLLKRNQVFWLNFKVAQFGEGHRKAKRNLFLACTSGTGCVRPPTAARRRRWPPRSSTSAGWSREPSPRGRWGSQGFAPESF